MLIKFRVLVLFFVACGCCFGICPQGDIDGDCDIDVDDLVLLCQNWLSEDFNYDINGTSPLDLNDFVMFSSNWNASGLPIVINEFMAINITVNYDETGGYDDWIEVLNPTDEPVDIGGSYFSDDPLNVLKSQIPTDNPSATTIPAGGYLLLWADGYPEEGPLHLNFSLSGADESIIIYGSDQSTLVDRVDYGSQDADISSGRFVDVTGPWQQMPIATPAASNENGFEGNVADVYFSNQQAFFDFPFELTLTVTTFDTNIYYTTNGEDPTVLHQMYTSPISIDASTCIRARAFRSDWKPSDIETNTYISVNSVANQIEPLGDDWSHKVEGIYLPNGQTISYTMDPDIVNQYTSLEFDGVMKFIPSISIVTEPNNLFGAETGIYVNASNRGIEWERPTSIELINPDGSRGFQIDAGLRIRGGASRTVWNPKHSFRLFFRSAYGKSKLKYPLFEDEGIAEFKKIDLRTAQNYSWNFENDSRNTFLREVFCRDLQGDMGQLYTKSRYCHLYLNGLYWGLYMTQERPDAEFAESYLGGNALEYDVVKRNNTGTQGIVATDGQLDSWYELWSKAQTADFSNNTDYFNMQGLNEQAQRDPNIIRYLDVDNLADYMVSIFYTGDRDAPITSFSADNKPNNFFMLFNRQNPDGFKIIRHDAEHTLDTGEVDRTGPFTAGGNVFVYSNPQWLHQKLAANQEYRLRFADRAHRVLRDGGVMDEQTSYDRFDYRKNQIVDAIIAEAARWGRNQHDKNEWLGAVQTARDFFIGRNDIVIEQLKKLDWYPQVNPPQFLVNDSFQYGGYADSGAVLSLTADESSVYYTLDGTDPRRTIVASDYEQVEKIAIFDMTMAKKAFVPSDTNGGVDMPCGQSGFKVLLYRSKFSLGNVGDAKYMIGDPAEQLGVFADQCDVVNYINGGTDANFDNGKNFPGCEDGSDVDNAAMQITGKVYISQAQAWTFGVNSDDGFEATISGHGASKTFSHYYGRGSADTFSVFYAPQAGYYDVEIIYFEGGGGAQVEFFAAMGEHSEFSTDFKLVGDVASGGLEVLNTWTGFDFDDSSWTSGMDAVGYDTGSDYAQYIDIDTKSQMYRLQVGCFVRIPFICDKDAVNQLILNAGYDDGFIAFINGVEVLRVNVDAGSELNSNTTASGAEEFISLQSFDITQWKNLLRDGQNVLAVHAVNVSNDSSDMIFNCQLLSSEPVIGAVAQSAIEYASPINLTESVKVMARTFNGTQWSALSEAIFSVGEPSLSLRISELMYNPSDIDAEFVELVNISSVPVSLNLIHFTSGIDYTFGDIDLAPQQRILVVENIAAFEAVHGTGHNIAGTYVGGLSNGGEKIVLEDALGNIVQTFSYSDTWYPITDDGGFSLTKIEPLTALSQSWSEKLGWMPSSIAGGSPGSDDSGLLPGTIVINEVLSHSHSLSPDWIELHNTSDQDVSIDGWFISDNATIPNKYEIVADGDAVSGLISAGGYVVFYQNTSFGSAFALSEVGEEVSISSVAGGVITGYSEVEDFSGSATGVSFGRYLASIGDWDFVSMQSPTPGAMNSLPLIPDVVISEIMYHPLDGGVEYVRLTNTTSSTIYLYDDILGVGWKFTNGFDYEFSSGSQIPAGVSVYVTDNTVVFAQLYPFISVSNIFGPFTAGKLSNGGETVEISFPGDVDENTGLPYYVVAEKVKYSDASPWPLSADGDGDSLVRINNNSYANNPVNWQTLSH